MAIKQWLPKSNSTIRQLAIVALATAVAIMCIFVGANPPSETGQRPVEDYERIYLSQGSIYAHKAGFGKTYDIVNGVQHVTREQYDDLVFFGTSEEAEAAGYEPSESFARDYACWKEGKDWRECWKLEYD